MQEALADLEDYSKQVGEVAVDVQNLTRRQMEFLQFIGYNGVTRPKPEQESLGG